MSTIETIIGECRTYGDRVDTHDHPYAQLLLPLQGSLFIQTLSHQFELNDAHLFFLPPHCQHTFYAVDRNQFLVLDIPQRMVPETRNDPIQGGIKTRLDDRWQAIRHLMLTEIEQTSASLHELFQYAYRLLNVENTPLSIQFIQANYSRSIHLETLAQIEGYHPTYYCEWFKSQTGTTPRLYIQTLRLNHAKQLLRETDLPILHIAQQVGYEHHASLTRLFKQFEHLTPQAYRQQSRKLDK